MCGIYMDIGGKYIGFDPSFSFHISVCKWIAFPCRSQFPYSALGPGFSPFLHVRIRTKTSASVKQCSYRFLSGFDLRGPFWKRGLSSGSVDRQAISYCLGRTHT